MFLLSNFLLNIVDDIFVDRPPLFNCNSFGEFYAIWPTLESGFHSFACMFFFYDVHTFQSILCVLRRKEFSRCSFFTPF